MRNSKLIANFGYWVGCLLHWSGNGLHKNKGLSTIPFSYPTFMLSGQPTQAYAHKKVAFIEPI